MAQKQILIVDDEEDIIDFVRMHLESRGFDVLSATNGEAAIEVALKERPALILLDVNMPGLSGFDVCQRLKAGPQTNGIPIVFLTAQGSEAHERKGEEVGGDAYLIKPFEMDSVLEIINAYLQS